MKIKQVLVYLFVLLHLNIKLKSGQYLVSD